MGRADLFLVAKELAEKLLKLAQHLRGVFGNDWDLYVQEVDNNKLRELAKNATRDDDLWLVHSIILDKPGMSEEDLNSR
jgi:hypothetical protein